MSLSNYLEGIVLDWLRDTDAPSSPSQLYVSLHTGDPGETGANEHGGTAAYVRVAIDLAAGASPVANDADVEFAEATADYSAAVTHAGLWDASSAGNFLVGGALGAPRTITTGVTPRFPAGDLTFALD